MTNPKSIFILHRANLTWLNLEIIRFMKKKYNTSFHVVATNTYIEKYNSHIEQKSIISYEKITEKAFNSRKKKLSDTYDIAIKNENKYGFSYLRDCIMQDRNYALSYLELFKNHLLTKSRSKLENYDDIIDAISFYINFFDKFFNDNKVDLVIARPDNLIGYVLSLIAKKNKIPFTVQLNIRENSYMYWSEGPYIFDNYVKQTAINIIKKKKLSRYVGKTSGHSIGLRAKLVKELTFLSLVKQIIIETIIWMIFLVKNKKREIAFYKIIMRKLRFYFYNIYLRKSFIKDFNEFDKKKFIYFPLPTEPEYVNHSTNKKFNNTHAIIQQILLSLPAGYNLIIKEHIINIGNKKLDFYKSLGKLPNVIFADHMISGPALLKKCSSVITVAGSSAIEAGELGKKVLVLADSVEYKFLPHVIYAESIKKMPLYLKQSIKQPSKSEIENIKKWTLAYKLAMRSIAYHVPNSKLFQGNNNKIKKNDLQKAVKELINQWEFQRKFKHTF